ncbi:MAG TPA: hypothetical protein VLA31_06960 [Burkholderiaceae bacterium]|nr:hypothetical protein [Burkholderiaceae bacterium]
MTRFIKIKVRAERTEFHCGYPRTILTNEIEDLIVNVDRIVQITPKGEGKCLVDIQAGKEVDTRWCVESADVVMNKQTFEIQ